LLKFIFIIIFFFTLIPLNAFQLSSKTTIVYDDKNIDNTTPIEELSLYLKQILNHKPKILKKISNRYSTITLIINPNSKLRDKKDESFIIESNQNSIIITAKNDHGLLYGVYHFLENYLGCKFLSPNYEYIPHFLSKKISNNIVDFQEPTFSYREIFIAEADDNIYATKCKLNGHLGHRALLTNNKDIFTEGINIESFTSAELIPPKYSCNGQFNFANKKAQQKASKRIKKRFKELHQNRKNYISLQHEDRNSFCREGLKKGELPSKTFSEYTKFLASQYPNKNFLSQSYLWSKQAPAKTIKFPENLGIFFSPIEANFAKPLKDQENLYLLENLKSWQPFTKNIFLWHYITNFGGYMLPYPDLYALDQDIKTASKIKDINGIFLQGSYSSLGGEFANLRIWVFSKLLWNPYKNIDSLIKTFCNSYYKEASDDVISYIKNLHQMIKDSDEKLSFKTSINAKYLNENNIAKLDKILQNGLKKLEPSSIYAKHLIDLYSSIDYLRIMRGGDLTKLKPIKVRFRKFLENNPNISAFAEGIEIENLHNIIDFNRKKSTPPKIAKNLKEGINWFDFQEYTLDLCCSEIIEDQQASNGVSARIEGSRDDWGFQLNMINFPKGKWDIYANIKIELNSKNSIIDKTKIALFYGIHPSLTQGAAIIGQFTDNQYKNIKIGTIDTSDSTAKTVWLSPPENSVVQYLYIDRIFLIRRDKLY